jgi:predicted amidohydrolase YtcJ
LVFDILDSFQYQSVRSIMCMNCDLTEALGAFATRAATAAPRPPFSQALGRRRFVGTSLACVAAIPASAVLASAAPAQTMRRQQVVPAATPNLVFRGGIIHTVAAGQPWAEAVAIRDKSIIAVGSNAEIGKLVGPATKVVELNGRLMLPGFVEGHTHPILGSFFSAGVDLQLPSSDDALAAIAQFAKAHPTGAVRGFGWRVDMFPPDGPSKAALDRILPDRPAFFFAIDGHSMWVNSKALEIAGVTRDTPDPVPGFSFYVRDASGEPTGYIMETVAALATVNAVEPISPAAMGDLLEGWLPKAAAAGITSVYDAGVPPIGDDQAALIALYTDLERRGRLPFRVVASYLVKAPPIGHAVRDAVALRRRIDTELVQVRMLKIVGDGTQAGYTALLLEPYADKPDTRGESPFSQQQWTALITEADAAGLDVHAQACGEGTVRRALNGFEAAIAANPKRDRRHTIAHLVLVDDADIPRFTKLGINAEFSANWMSADPDSAGTMLERYGPERHRQIYRPRAMLNAGARISFGTDWPAAGYFATYKPLDAIQIAVTRQLIGKPDAPVLEPADERLDLEQAIHANTMGAAYQLHLEHQVGSIEVGKLADLVVLEKNIFAVDKHDIARTRIDMTVMNGRFTHGAG